MRVRITASRHSAFYSPLLCTMAGGFLEKHGLEYAYAVLAPGETAAGMIREGRTDVMQTAPSTNWAKMDQGETGFPLNFALINQRDGFSLVARESSGAPFHWHDLEGRTLLADHGSQPLTMLRYAVRHNGADWEKIQVVNAGPAAEMIAAFRSGSADFVHLQAPAPQLLEQAGVGRTAVSVGASMPENAFSSLCASREFIGGPAFPLFVKAFSEAKDWVRRAPAEEVAAKEAAYFPDIDPAVLASAVAGYQRIGTWNGGAGIPRDLYDQSLNVFESAGRIRQRHPYGEVCFPLDF